jgi:hypothetical protein
VTKTVKATLFVISGTLAFPIVAWIGTWGYWHFRITGATRGIEEIANGTKNHEPTYGESYSVLMSARCRSLPYLINAMDPGKPVWFLTELQFFIRSGYLPIDGSTDDDLDDALREFRIDPFDSPQLIRTKCEGWRKWWNDSGHKYHQWWRVWSSSCRHSTEAR